MGAIAVIIVSFVALFAYSRFGPMQDYMLGRDPGFESGRALSRAHIYEPPARKAIMVDTDGLSHPTADNTPAPRRDRSSLIPQQALAPAPNLETENRTEAKQLTPVSRYEDVALSATTSVEKSSITQEMDKPAATVETPANQSLSTTTAAEIPGNQKTEVAPGAENSLDQKVQTAIMADPTLSHPARSTLSVTLEEGKIILNGAVLDKEEKARIFAEAGEIVGTKNLDNRLRPLHE